MKISHQNVFNVIKSGCLILFSFVLFLCFPAQIFSNYGPDLNRSFEYINFHEIKSTAMSTNRIERGELRSRTVLARTNQGNYAKLQVASGDDLLITRIHVYNRTGCIILTKSNVKVRSSYSFDIDSGRETSSGADFWWHGVRPGVHYLESKNGARFALYRGYDQIGFNDLKTLDYRSINIPRTILRRQIILIRTNEGRYSKLEVLSGDDLLIRRMSTYNNNGTLRVSKSNLEIRSSYSCDLDSGSETSNGADFWWHGVSPGVHYLEPRNGAKISFPSYFTMCKYDSLFFSSLICNAMVWQDASGSKNYGSWNYDQKAHLKEFLFGLESGNPFPIYNPPPLSEDRYINPCDAWMIYLTHVSHSLWIQANQKVRWSITSLSSDQLDLLLDSRKLMDYSASKNKYSFGVMGNVTDWNIRFSYDFMKNNGFIKTDQSDTVYAFGGWCRSHLIHISGSDSNPDGYQRLYGYRGPPLVNRILDPLPGKNHVTAGCWGTSGLYAAVMRSVNIPVVHGRSVFAHPGDSPGTHSRIELPTINRGLSHSDDLYNAILFPCGNIVPTSKVFVSINWLRGNVDNPTQLDCRGSFCNRKEDQASYNSQKYLLRMAVSYLTDYILYQRAQDANESTPPTRLENVLTGPSVGGVIVEYPKPYYTQAERQDIIRSVDDKLKSLGGGNWEDGKRLVIDRWNTCQANR